MTPSPPVGTCRTGSACSNQGRARTAGEEWATIEAIKQALDPAAIIALGKYGP
jgi:hypothetical protein